MTIAWQIQPSGGEPFFFYCIRSLHLQAEDQHAFAAFEMEFTPLIPSRIPVQYD